MSVYDDIQWSAPNLAAIQAMCTKYPATARLRNADGQDIGSAGGDSAQNHWEIQPATSNGDCSTVVNWALQEATRIGGLASVKFSAGDFYFHTFLHQPDPMVKIRGAGKYRTRLHSGQANGTYMAMLSRTPAEGATYSDAEIFNLDALPSLFSFYCMDRNTYSAQISDLSMLAHSSMTGRVGAKWFDEGAINGPVSANPEWDNAHLLSFVNTLSYLNYNTIIADVNENIDTVIPVGYVNLRLDATVRLVGARGDLIPALEYGLPCVLGAVVVGSHAKLLLEDPLIETTGGGPVNNFDGTPVMLVSETPFICGDIVSKCDISGCTYSHLLFDFAAKPTDLVNYEKWDLTGLPSVSKFVIDGSRIEDCGNDTLSGFPVILTEGGADADIYITNNQFINCGGMFQEFSFGRGWHIPIYDLGQRNKLVILDNYSENSLGHLPIGAGWFCSIGMFAGDDGGDPCHGFKPRSEVTIKNNDLFSTDPANMFDGITIGGQDGPGNVIDNFVQSSGFTVEVFCSTDLNVQNNEQGYTP